MLSDFKSEIKLFFIVAAASVALALGGIWLLQAGVSNVSNHVSNQVTHMPSPALSPQPQTSDTEGWQTYRNTEFGFELKYPTTGIVKEYPPTGGKDYFSACVQGDKEGGLTCHNPRIMIDVKSKAAKQSELSYANTVYQKTERIEVDGIEALKFTRPTELAPVNYVIVGHETNTFIISSTPPSVKEMDFDQILSTFRFLDGKENLKIDANVVWTILGLPEIYECRAQTDCVVSVMRQNNATEQSIEFFMQTEWFAVEFRDHGMVDLITLENPWRANANVDYMLVNEQSSYIIIEEEVPAEKIMDYSILTNAFPKYSIWGTDNWFIEYRDQSFVFGFDVKDERGCHACSSGYIAIIAFEFDQQGNYIGPRLLEVRPQE